MSFLRRLVPFIPQRLYDRLIHIAKVGAVGLSGFVLQSLIFEIIGIQLGLVRPSIAVLIGGEVAILSNFFFNARFNFTPQGTGPLLSRLIRFHLVVFVSIFIQWLFVFGAEELYPGNTLLLRVAYLSGIALGFVTNYLGYCLIVWRQRAAPAATPSDI